MVVVGAGSSFPTHVSPVGVVQGGWVWSNTVHAGAQHIRSTPQAYITTLDTLGDNSWNPNFGATHT